MLDNSDNDANDDNDDGQFWSEKLTWAFGSGELKGSYNVYYEWYKQAPTIPYKKLLRILYAYSESESHFNWDCILLLMKVFSVAEMCLEWLSLTTYSVL